MKTIRLTEEKRVRELIELASKVFKISERTIRASTRKQKFHLIRVAISNVARSQGIHYNSISKGLKRHRSSVYHYEKIHEYQYENFLIYKKIFNILNEAVKEIARPLLSRAKIQDLLRENNLIHDSKEVFIHVTSGYSGYSLRSKKADFTNKVEKIKSILQDFSHDITIQL